MEHHYIWKSESTLASKPFICGHCGHPVASEKGYKADVSDDYHLKAAFIYICHQCHRPTFFDFNGAQTPHKPHGKAVPTITDSNVAGLYREACDSFSAGAFTASTMCCRKLLMNIAVAKGAEENKKFEYYVKYLADNHHIPAGTEDWVDTIRKQGNGANHEINLSSNEEAEDMLGFTEMLLRLIYEFPSRASKYKKDQTS